MSKNNKNRKSWMIDEDNSNMLTIFLTKRRIKCWNKLFQVTKSCLLEITHIGHVEPLIYIIVHYCGLFQFEKKSQEYYITKEMCDLCCDSKLYELPPNQYDHIIQQIGAQNYLKWGDVISVNSCYRNLGRRFWINRKTIPFCSEYDDYGSVYPWMTCNRTGSTLYWKDTTDGHNCTIFFDPTGYKITSVDQVKFIVNNKYYCHPATLTTNETIIITLSNDQQEKWYLDCQGGVDVVKNINYIFQHSEGSKETKKKQIEEEDFDPKLAKQCKYFINVQYSDLDDNFYKMHPHYDKERMFFV